MHFQKMQMQVLGKETVATKFWTLKIMVIIAKFKITPKTSKILRMLSNGKI